MKLLYGGIHRHIGHIVQHSGGYDREYHITHLSSKLNIDRESISRLFQEAAKSNLYHYIELLENGMPMKTVFEFMEKDNEIRHKKFEETLAIAKVIIRNNSFNIY